MSIEKRYPCLGCWEHRLQCSRCDRVFYTIPAPALWRRVIRAIVDWLRGESNMSDLLPAVVEDSMNNVVTGLRAQAATIVNPAYAAMKASLLLAAEEIEKQTGRVNAALDIYEIVKRQRDDYRSALAAAQMNINNARKDEIENVRRVRKVLEHLFNAVCIAFPEWVIANSECFDPVRKLLDKEPT